MEGGMNMNRVIDFVMTKLFQLAEYVCSRYSSILDESAATQTKQKVIPTIHFTNEDRSAIKPTENDACINTFECKQTRLNIKMVEGELFK